MRSVMCLLVLTLLNGCTALVVGGESVGGYQLGDDGRVPAVVAADDAITSDIEQKIVADSVVSVFNITVRTYEGTVTLTGNVTSATARNQAHKLARETNGVVAVSNKILVKNGSDPR